MVPSSGGLWSYDFGSKRQVIREPRGPASDPPFQVAQVRADRRDLLLVLFTLAPPSIAEQYAIRRVLAEHARAREVAFLIDQGPGYAAVVGSEAELVDHFAAAVAVVRSCWGWDESTLFTVHVDEFEFAVALEFSGEVWTAWPDPVSRGRALP